MKRRVLYNADVKRYLRVHWMDSAWCSWDRVIKSSSATYFRDEDHAEKARARVLREQRGYLREEQGVRKALNTYLETRWQDHSLLSERVASIVKNNGRKWPSQREVALRLKGEERDINKRLKKIEEIQKYVLTEIDVPLGFDGRRRKIVKFTDNDESDKEYCACCGVQIPHQQYLMITIGYKCYNFCPVCLKRIGESAAPIAEAFERENPDFIEAYHTEKFLMDL